MFHFLCSILKIESSKESDKIMLLGNHFITVLAASVA